MRHLWTQDLYDKHIHDQSERRFIVEKDNEMVGLVELVEIDYIHRRTEFQIIIDELSRIWLCSGCDAFSNGLRFSVLNMHKIYVTTQPLVGVFLFY